MSSEIAAKTAGLLGDFQKYIDTDMQSIHGKSAYEIAKANGYVGTESEWLTSLMGKSAYEVARDGGYAGTQAEWLESLKAAGEWSRLDSRTSMFEPMPYFLRNNIYRGKCLGETPTDEQYAAIAAGTFDDMFIGDYWLKDGVYYRILDINYYRHLLYWIGRPTDPATGTTRKLNWEAKHYGDETWKDNPALTITGNGNATHYQPNHVIVGMDVGWQGDSTYYTTEDGNTTDGFVGHTACNWYRTIRPEFVEKYESVFGADHMLEWRGLFATGFDGTGAVKGEGEFIAKCELMPSGQVSGTIAVERFGKGRTASYCLLGDLVSNRQFAIFRIADVFNGRDGYLRDCVGLVGSALATCWSGNLDRGRVAFLSTQGTQNGTTRSWSNFTPYICLGNVN